MKTAEKGWEIKRILVAVDGSENAKRAVGVASQIAENNNAELTVLYVIVIPPAVYSGDVQVDIGKIESEARREAEKVVSTASSLAEQKGVKPKTAIVQRMDSAVKGITDYADKNTIDLIGTYS